VVRVSRYRFSGLGSIPGDIRFSEKSWVWNGVHSAYWVQLGSHLEEKVVAPVWKTEIAAVWIRCADHATPIFPQILTLTSTISGCRSVDILVIRSRTKATELRYYYYYCSYIIVQQRSSWQNAYRRHQKLKRFVMPMLMPRQISLLSHIVCMLVAEVNNSRITICILLRGLQHD
jgi:hypothetical protein